jgi:probable HAF family extracellular repeat protein
MNRLQHRATLFGSVFALGIALICASTHADGQASFLIFQPPPGARSVVVNAISGDGSVVVGWATDTNSNQKAIRYTPSAGAGAFDYLASTQQSTKATDVSFDGSTIVGTSQPSFGRDVPAIWSAGGSVELLPSPVADRFVVSPSVSGQGSLVALSSATLVSDSSQPGFAWTRSTGYLPLQSTFTVVVPDEISATGDVIVGGASFPFAPGDAFRWTQSGGIQFLSTSMDAFRDSAAGATNADGTIIVGNYLVSAGGAAFRWTQDTGMIPFDDGPGTGTMISPSAMSADGSVIVGWGGFNGSFTAAIWDAVHGTRRLTDVLAARGVDVGNFNLSNPYDISADGTKIVGVGYNSTGAPQPWYVELPVPEPATATLFVFAAIAPSLRRPSRRIG